MFEARSEHECFIVEDFAVAERHSVGMWVDFLDGLTSFDPGPSVNHTRETGTLNFLGIDLSVASSEVRGGVYILLSVSDNAHFQILSIVMLLKELGKSGDIQSSYTRDTKLT